MNKYIEKIKAMVIVIQTRDCSVCGWLYSWSDNILTPEFGFGMLAMV